MISIFEPVNSPKKGPSPIKTRVIWVLGTYMYIFSYNTVSLEKENYTWIESSWTFAIATKIYTSLVVWDLTLWLLFLEKGWATAHLYYPYHPCMVYLHENQPNVGRYTIHGWYGLYGIYVFLHRLCMILPSWSDPVINQSVVWWDVRGGPLPVVNRVITPKI